MIAMLRQWLRQFWCAHWWVVYDEIDSPDEANVVLVSSRCVKCKITKAEYDFNPRQMR